MNANAKKWVQALRSGKFKQAEGALKKGDSYCCLGVACELYIQSGNTLMVRGDEKTNQVSFDDSIWTMPFRVRTWLGLREESGGMGPGKSLASLNDVHGLTFSQIAEVIEICEDKLFLPEVSPPNPEYQYKSPTILEMPNPAMASECKNDVSAI